MTTSLHPPLQIDGMAIALNAIRNASRAPVTPADVVRILRTGRGHPSHVRALFGDASLDTLMRLAIALGIETAMLRASYARAKMETAAANAGLDSLHL